MKYRGVHIRGANVDTLACVVLVRILERPEIAQRLAATLTGLKSSTDPVNQLAVDQVESALAEMRGARSEFSRHRDELDGSASGTSEPALAADGESSASLVNVLSHRVDAVAERLELSESYVKRLCRDKALSATKSGREWLIDEESVAEYEAARRPVA